MSRCLTPFFVRRPRVGSGEYRLTPANGERISRSKTVPVAGTMKRGFVSLLPRRGAAIVGTFPSGVAILQNHIVVHPQRPTRSIC